MSGTAVHSARGGGPCSRDMVPVLIGLVRVRGTEAGRTAALIACQSGVCKQCRGVCWRKVGKSVQGGCYASGAGDCQWCQSLVMVCWCTSAAANKQHNARAQ
jgi:hypothetical protein